MSSYITKEPGTYFVWASDPACRKTRVLVDGASATDRAADSTLGPFFGDATVNLALDLASGCEITVTPESVPLIVRRASDGKVVYDSGEQLS
jgi:hypothetical protein